MEVTMTNALLAHAVTEPVWIDEPRTLREAFPERRPNCDPRVPYERLETCVQDAWVLFPNATKIIALWTPTGISECAAEVWHGNRARVYPHDRLTAALHA